jgi:hypothetical protein
MQAENRKASNAAAKIASLDIILADLFIRVLVGIYLYSIPPVKLHKVGAAPAKRETAGMLGTHGTDLDNPSVSTRMLKFDTFERNDQVLRRPVDDHPTGIAGAGRGVRSDCWHNLGAEA